MMRLAVLSDIHGNLAALETILADLDTAGGADKIWCLGDLAALGYAPAACIQRIRELVEQGTTKDDDGKVTGQTFQVIGGNTDRYLVKGTRFPLPSAKDSEGFQKFIRDVTERDTILNWNLAQLSWEDYEFLKKIRGAELSLDVPEYGWVIGYHAVPGDDEAFLTPDTPSEEAADYLLDREGRLGIGGHTHVQMDRDLGKWRAVNVGSVGLSIDRPGHAQYGIFTFEGDSVHVDLRNVPYDVDAVLAEAARSGYPIPSWLEARLRRKD